MKKIEPHEHEIIGAWISEGKRIRGDEACERIQWLVKEVLQQVGVDKASGGWDKLFRDPADGRYWLLTYPSSAMQGGGPPALKQLPLTDQEAKEKFVSPEEWNKHMEKLMRERNIRVISSKDSKEE